MARTLRSEQERYSRKIEQEKLAKALSGSTVWVPGQTREADLNTGSLVRETPTSSHQVAQLGAGAIKAVNAALRDAGINGFQLFSKDLEIRKADRANRMNLIREAKLTVGGTIPFCDGTQVGNKEFSVSVSFNNGRYAVEGFFGKDRDEVFPIKKENVKKSTDCDDKKKKEAAFAADKMNTPSEDLEKLNVLVEDAGTDGKRQSESERDAQLWNALKNVSKAYAPGAYETVSNIGSQIGKGLEGVGQAAMNVKEQASDKLNQMATKKVLQKQIGMEAMAAIHALTSEVLQKAHNEVTALAQRYGYEGPEIAKWFSNQLQRSLQQVRVGEKKVAQAGLLANPESTDVATADADMEVLRAQAQSVDARVKDIQGKIQAFQDALASKEAVGLGMSVSSMAELQTKLSQMNSELETKIKNVPANFIRFADNVTYAKIQAVRLNDASWKEMIDTAKERGKGVMKRVVTILDRISILFKKLTVDVKLKEYAPGELTAKEMEKITKKNVKDLGRVKDYQESIEKQGPGVSKYFLESATGGVQRPVGGQKRTAQEVQMEFEFMDELFESLVENVATLNQLTQQSDQLKEQADKKISTDEQYPLPKQASKAFKFSSACAKHGSQGVRRTYAKKAQKDSKSKVSPRDIQPEKVSEESKMRYENRLKKVASLKAQGWSLQDIESLLNQ